jgi:transposase
MYLVNLSEEQRLALQERTRARGVAPATRDRLEMVRLSDAGWSVPRIAKHLGVYETTVRTWIKAYLSAQMPSDGHSGSGGFDALVNKKHLGKRSALTQAMLDSLRQEVEKGERTWTARQLGEWLAREYGVTLSEGRLRLHLKRAGLTWQRTSRNLKHKQKPEEVAQRRAALQTLEKGGTKG